MPSPLQDYVTYWMHRMYHLPSLYRDGHHTHSNDGANWAKLTFFQLKRLNLPKLNARKCIRVSALHSIRDRRHFHKLHHTYKQPTAFSVTAIHPVEFVNIQAVYASPMFFMPVHVGKCVSCHNLAERNLNFS